MRLAILAGLWAVAPIAAQHPRLLLDAADRAAIQARASANTPEWQALKSRCDAYVNKYVRYPDWNGLTGSVNAPGSGTDATSPVVYPDYQGEAFLEHTWNFGACYLATKGNGDFDPSVSAAYGAKLKWIAYASSRTPAKVRKAIAYSQIVVSSNVATVTTPAAHGLKKWVNLMISGETGDSDLNGDWYVASVPNTTTFTFATSNVADGTYTAGTLEIFLWIRSSASAAGQAQSFYMKNPANFAVEDTVTISGVTGNTAANGAWKIATWGSTSFTIKNTDGTPAPLSNGAQTNYAHHINYDGGYGIRNYGLLLALIYDWAYDELDATLRSEIVVELQREVIEMNRRAAQDIYSYRTTVGHPSHNYFAGYFAAVTLANISLGADDWRGLFAAEETNAFSGADFLRDYFNRWLPGGGYPQGFRHYGYNAVRNILTAVLAKKIAGTDWTQPPHSFTWPDGLLKYFMQFVTPPKTELDDNNYVAKGPAMEVLRVNLTTAVFMTHFARKMGSPYAAKTQNFYTTVDAAIQAAAGGGVTPGYAAAAAWAAFLFYDPAAPSEDFTALDRTHYGFEGTYAVTRSDWTSDATYLTFDSTIEIDNVDQGKVHRNAGAVTMRRGRRHLVVYGLGEAARSYTASAQYDAIHAEGVSGNNRKDPGFWADRPGGLTGWQQSYSQCASPTNAVPTISREHVPAVRSGMPRKEDAGSYVYWRGANLHCNARQSSVDSLFHNQDWTRDVLFIRDRVAVVYDRTTTALADDDRFINWVTQKTPVEAAAPAGMKKYEVSDGGTFKGALTFVLPASPAVTVVDHKGYGWLYHLEVRPPALNAADVNFLAVLDTAADPSQVETVTKLPASNLDAVQLSASGVAGFVPGDSVTLPITYAYTSGPAVMHRIVGLPPQTAYNVDTSVPGQVTITDGTGHVTSAAGVLEFLTGGGSGTLAIGTASLPDGRVGIFYEAPLAGSGGSPPYTWSVAAGSLPPGVNLGQSTGILSGTPESSGTFTVTFRLTDNAQAAATKTLSIIVAPSDPVIETVNLALGVAGVPYSEQLTAGGGTPPYSWSVVAGALPAELSLSASGLISGTPMQAGSSTFTVRVSDAAQKTATQELTLTVNLYPLSLSALVTSDQAVVRYGRSGLDANTACVLTVRALCADCQNEIVFSHTDQGGPALRTAVAAELLPASDHIFAVDCGAQQAQDTYRTPAAGQGSLIPLRIAAAPPPGLAIAKLRLEYGNDPASLSQSAAMDCVPSCTATVPAAFDSVLYLRWVWEDSEGRPIARGTPRPIVVR